MKETKTQAATSYLESATHDLKFIYDKIRALKLIQEKVQKHLDPSLAKHCQVANLANNKLVILVTNGSIATQLRYQSAELLNKFRHDASLQHVREVECKVRTNQLKSNEPVSTYEVERLSEDTAEIVREMAETIEDPRLRDIMLRISQRTVNESS